MPNVIVNRKRLAGILDEGDTCPVARLKRFCMQMIGVTFCASANWLRTHIAYA
jgi:hypothetical protein